MKRHIGLIFCSLVFITLLLFNISCAKTDCLSVAGKRTSQSRTVEPFTKMEIYNYFNVYLKKGNENKIEIEAGENEIKNIETSITDKTLIIKDLNVCPFLKGYSEKNLYITTDTLSNVIIYDGVNLYSQDTLKQDEIGIRFLSDIGHCDLAVDCQNFYFETWYASGDFILKGKTGYLYLSMEKLSFIDASRLEAESCYIYNNSMGDAYIKAKEILEVHIKNSGNVFYLGTPIQIMLLEKTGSGKLIKND